MPLLTQAKARLRVTELAEQLEAMGANALPLNYETLAAIAKDLAWIADRAPCPHRWVKTSAKNGWLKCSICLHKRRGVNQLTTITVRA